MKYKVSVHIIENNKNVYTEDKAKFESSGDAVHWAGILGRRYSELGAKDISVVVYKSNSVGYATKLYYVAYSPEKTLVAGLRSELCS